MNTSLPEPLLTFAGYKSSIQNCSALTVKEYINDIILASLELLYKVLQIAIMLKGGSSSSSSNSSNSTPERSPNWIDAELETDDGKVLRGRMSANEDTFEHGWDVYKRQWDGTYKKSD